MHLQSPRTLESMTVMHMSLMFNSFEAQGFSDYYRSVKAEPIGKASNANALINRSLCSHKLTQKAYDSLAQHLFVYLDIIVTQFRPSNCRLGS
jgi:hypothetical protein